MFCCSSGSFGKLRGWHYEIVGYIFKTKDVGHAVIRHFVYINIGIRCKAQTSEISLHFEPPRRDIIYDLRDGTLLFRNTI